MLLLIPICFVFFGWLIFGKRENPYIRKHKRKWRNDKEYFEYLDWLNKKGGDVPLKKSRIKEDIDIEKEINETIK